MDHRKETTRLQEMHTIGQDIIRHQQHQQTNRPELATIPDFWIGDFNALTKEDYTKQEWDEITNIREGSCWERPRTDLTEMLQSMIPSQRKKKSLFLPIQLRDAGARRHDISGPIGTCRFGTRTDYVYFNEKRLIKEAGGWRLIACEHVGDAHGSNASNRDRVGGSSSSKSLSDHNLVIATFESL